MEWTGSLFIWLCTGFAQNSLQWVSFVPIAQFARSDGLKKTFPFSMLRAHAPAFARHTFLPQWIQIVRTTQIHTSIAIGPLLTNQLEKIYFRLANIQCNEKLITTADQVANAIYTLFTRCHCCYNKRNVTSQFCPIKSNTHIQWMNWPNYIRAHR